MSQNVIRPTIKTRANPLRVWFTGTTALKQGQLVCYDRDYGTAADADGTRDNYVEIASTSNNYNVAGVCAQDYAANPGGQMIEIYEPGSVCMISTLIATTVNATKLTALVGVSGVSGRFGAAAYGGRGTARALQTVAAISSSTDTTPGPIGSSLDGSATWTAATRTLTKTSAFTNAAAGDKVIVVGAVVSASTTVGTMGEYTVESVTSANAVVLTTSIMASDGTASFYLVRGNPAVLALLEDGEESGLQEWITPYTDGSGTTAVPSMVGGYTNIFGGFTLATGNAIDTLANGTFIGQKKGWKLLGALTTSDYVVTVTEGEGFDGTTDMDTLTFDGANDETHVQWMGPHWRPLANVGTAIA